MEEDAVRELVRERDFWMGLAHRHELELLETRETVRSLRETIERRG